MKIEVFEIKSREDKIYQELLEQYKTNSELRGLLNKDIIPSELIMMGDFRLITMLDRVIEDWDNIKVYLVKDVDNDTFLWVIGKFEKEKDTDKHSALINMTMDEEGITMYPLLRKQSKKLQLAIRKALIEKDLMKELNAETENLPNDSKEAWENLFKALDKYSGIFIDLTYTQGVYLKRINESLEEEIFKYCSETVKSAVETIVKCLKINPDYDTSIDSFLGIAKIFNHYLNNVKERNILKNIFSENNLIKLSGKVGNIISYYLNELEDEEKIALKTLHDDICMSLSKLCGLLIVYNRLKPNKAVFRAKEALGEWAASDQSFKASTLEEWEKLEIPKWK